LFVYLFVLLHDPCLTLPCHHLFCLVALQWSFPYPVCLFCLALVALL